MPHHDLLKLADLALAGHVRPNLPEEVTRILAQASGARAGVLLNGDARPEAWWPESGAPAETTGEGWVSFTLGHDRSQWKVLLQDPSAHDEALLIAARLALHVWDLREALRQTKFDERFRLWELEAVRSIVQGLGGVLDPEAIGREVLGHVVSLLGVRNGEIVLEDPEGTPRVLAVFGEPVLERPIPETVWARGFRRPHAVVAVPAGDGTVPRLLLAVSHKEARAGTAPFDENDVRLLDLFAVQTAVALENARLSRASIEQARLQQEMAVAAAIQSHLYPKESVEIPGVRVRTSFQPARQVGGDLFEVIRRGDELLTIVADVSGKGVGAGLIAAGLHAGIRLLAAEEVPVETIARRLNAYLVTATEDNRFATMAVVQMAPDGSFTALHAGHCPSLLRRANGTVETIGSSGLPLGIVGDPPYRPAVGHLDPGDLIVLYTDGLTEAVDAGGDELGTERLREIVRSLDVADPDGLCGQVLDGVRAFTGPVPFQDDATIVILNRFSKAPDGS